MPPMPPNTHSVDKENDRVCDLPLWEKSSNDGPMMETYPVKNKATESDATTALLRAKVDSFSTRGYVNDPTPVEYMPRLTKYCDGPELYVKRDDLLPLAGGGSKTRKLGKYWRAEFNSSAALLNVPRIPLTHKSLFFFRFPRSGSH